MNDKELREATRKAVEAVGEQAVREEMERMIADEGKCHAVYTNCRNCPGSGNYNSEWCANNGFCALPNENENAKKSAKRVLAILDEDEDDNTDAINYCLTVFDFILSGKKASDESIKKAMGYLEAMK